MVKLFLDDNRWPPEAAKWMHKRVGSEDNLLYLDPDWQVVRNYPQFVDWIEKNGLPDLISFDHDLADGHYHQSLQEGSINYESENFNSDLNKTGYHAITWLIDYCREKSLPLPECLVHTMNPVGKQNIEAAIESYYKLVKHP